MADAGQPDVQTFLFADLAGFTALTEVHGDERAADLVSRFCREVGAMLPEDAEQVKSIGDAVLVRVRDAVAAVGLGVRIVEEIGGRHEFPVVRVGMHSGPAVEREGDWFGSTVNVAARVASAAQGGEVLVTGETRACAGDLGDISFDDRGAHRLRNVGSSVRLHRARRSGSQPRTFPLDPVCRMAVDAAHSIRLHHGGQELHFCSDACATAFHEEPEFYVDVRSAPGVTRASDDERNATVARLTRAGTEGRLVLEELTERIDAALRAVTRQQLDQLLRDLPAASLPESQRARRRWALAIMSGSRRRGRWRVGSKLGAFALMGGAVIDLRHAEMTEPEVHIRAVAIMGGVRILVPEGTRVRGSGVALMGGNDLSGSRRDQAAEVPGTPLVHVHAFSLMGGVRVVAKRWRGEEWGAAAQPLALAE